jgi:hypothetical protein
VIASGSRRSGGEAWTVGAIDFGSGTAAMTAFVYCMRGPGPLERSGSATVPVTSQRVPHATAYSAPCPRRRTAFSGGYSSPLDVNPPGSAVMVYESQLVSRAGWAASGIEVGGAGGSGILTVSALCA